MIDLILEAAELQDASETLREVAKCVASVASHQLDNLTTDLHDSAYWIADQLGPDDYDEAWQFIRLDERLIDRATEYVEMPLTEAVENVAHQTLFKMARKAIEQIEGMELVTNA